MREFFIMLLILAAGSAVFAQENQYRFQIGGTAAYSIYRANGSAINLANSAEEGTRIDLSPEFGYFIKEGTMLGLALQFSSSQNRQQNIGGPLPSTNIYTLNTGTLSASIFAKQHWPVGKRIYIAAILGGGYGISGNKVSEYDEGTSLVNFSYLSGGNTEWRIFALPEFQVYLNKRLVLRFLLSGIDFQYGIQKSAMTGDLISKELDVHLASGDWGMGIFFNL